MTRKGLFNWVIAASLVTGIAGFSIAYLIYKPVMENYVFQINNLTSNVSVLTQTVSGLQQTVSAQKS